MTFFSSTELPTTQSAPTSAAERMNAQCLTSVRGPIIQGAPRYADGNTVSGEANKIYAYCAKVEGSAESNSHNCDYKDASQKKVSLTLNAPDAVYTGEAYKEAWVSNWSITDIGLAAKPEIRYYCLNDNHVETKTDASNSGAASEGAAPKNAGRYRAKVTITDGTNPGTTVTAMKDFAISPLTIDTVAFKEPTTTPGSSQATSLSIQR